MTSPGLLSSKRLDYTFLLERGTVWLKLGSCFPHFYDTSTGKRRTHGGEEQEGVVF